MLFPCAWASQNDNLGRISKCREETQVFSGQWIVCHNPGALFSWVCRPHTDRLQINSGQSCSLLWTGLIWFQKVISSWRVLAGKLNEIILYKKVGEVGVVADSKDGEKLYVGGVIPFLQSYKRGIIISILKMRNLSLFEGQLKWSTLTLSITTMTYDMQSILHRVSGQMYDTQGSRRN